MKKAILYLVLFLLLLLLALQASLYFYGDEIMRVKCMDYAKNKLHADSISIQNLQISFWNQELNVTNLQLTIPSLSENGNNRIQVHLPKMGISFGNLFGLTSGDYRLKQVEIPLITVKINSSEHRKNSDSDKNKKITQYAIQLDTLIVKQIRFEMNSPKGGFNLVSNGSLSLGNLMFEQRNRFSINTPTIAIELTNSFLELTELEQEMRFTKATSNGRDVTLEQLEWKPTLPQDAFFSTQTSGQYYVRMSVPEISLERINIDPQKLHKGFSIGQIHVKQLLLETFSNLSLPKSNKHIRLPLEHLSRVKIPFRVTTLRITDGQIDYQQFRNEKKGELRITGVDVRTGAIFNTGYTPNDSLVVHWRNGFWGKSQLSARIAFAYQSPKASFNIDGHLQPTSLLLFNPIVEPVTGAKFVKGYALSSTFQIRGDRYKSEGEVNLQYKDLSIRKAGKDSITHTASRLNWSATQLMNMPLRKNNLKDDKGYRQGEIHYIRQPNETFPKYVWASLRSGLFDAVSSAGQTK